MSNKIIEYFSSWKESSFSLLISLFSLLSMPTGNNFHFGRKVNFHLWFLYFFSWACELQLLVGKHLLPFFIIKVALIFQNIVQPTVTHTMVGRGMNDISCNCVQNNLYFAMVNSPIRCSFLQPSKSFSVLHAMFIKTKHVT